MNNYLTIKFRYFFEWTLKQYIQDIRFHVYKHTMFVDDIALNIIILDKTNNYWSWSFGLLKPDKKFIKVGNRTEVDILGGQSWNKIFGRWVVCIYRDNKNHFKNIS